MLSNFQYRENSAFEQKVESASKTKYRENSAFQQKFCSRRKVPKI
jgi:hypothetical protein